LIPFTDSNRDRKKPENRLETAGFNASRRYEEEATLATGRKQEQTIFLNFLENKLLDWFCAKPIFAKIKPAPFDKIQPQTRYKPDTKKPATSAGFLNL